MPNRTDLPAFPAGDPGLTGSQLDQLLAQARHLAAQGVDFFLLREPDLSARGLVGLARAILAIFRDTAAPTRLLIHSRPDIALACGAHGVHLPSTPGQLAPTHIHELYRLANRMPPIVSVSCHTPDDVHRAVTAPKPPDLLLFGPVFEKRVRGEFVQSGTGLDLLRTACQLAGPVPVLALGGVTAANTAECLQAGAAGVAGIRLFSPRKS